MTAKDEILAALPKLTQSELEVVHGLSGHLLGVARLPVTGTAQAIINALLTATGQPTGYLNPLAATQWKAFEARVANLTLFLNQHFKGWDDNKITQLAFLTMLFQLLTDDLKRHGVKPTLGVMLINLKRIPQIFDDAFPDYLESGMGHVILSKFKGNKS